MFYNDKKFNPKNIENGIYNFWNENGLFKSKLNKNRKKNFSIILPPPNVTGHLHLGHAWDGTIQDTIIRYKKLNGYSTFWLAGTDHAGIATQTKFDTLAKKQNLKFKNEKDYLAQLDNWAHQQENYIINQWAKLGFNLNLDIKTFTLDDNVKKLVLNSFINLYKKGLIYKGLKLVNWDCKLQTAISDIEVIRKASESKLYYFKYPLAENPNEYLLIATTRPETMFGDTNIFVNPKDKRYTKYINKYVINPTNNKKLKILTDNYIDMNFGTGVMKCTPAHDFNDYKLALSHKIKDYYSVINPNGTLNQYCKIDDKSYENIDRIKARPLIVQQLKDKGYLLKIENTTSEIGYSERTNEIVEPLLSEQWFIKMKPIIAEYKKSKEIIKFIPPRFKQTINTWFKNLDDWCISRQLKWGHKIPAYYGPKNQIYVGNKPPENYIQDHDVLDTWFSSGLWPIATTIKNSHMNLKDLYPTNILVTAYDILFFWVARMIFQCFNLTKKIPFKNVLIHGLIRDEQNRKMSKSLGNGIEPNDVINRYGADALRLFLIASSTLGEDLRFSTTKLDYMSNFLNKLWNVHNFINNYDKKSSYKQSIIHPINIWIINKFNEFIKRISSLYEKFNFTLLVKEIIDFTWDTFCNNYLELTHPLIQDNNFKDETLFLIQFIYKNILIILHPICPFITECLYQDLSLKNKISILFEPWPKQIKINSISLHPNHTEIIINTIKSIREIRIKNNVKNSHIIKINLINNQLNKQFNLIQKIMSLYNINLLAINKNTSDKDFITIRNNNVIFEYCNDFTSKSDQHEKLLKQKTILESEIKRSQSLLNNKNFIEKANKNKVENEKAKYKKYLADYELIKKELEESI